jgi:hypothetical protein
VHAVGKSGVGVVGEIVHGEIMMNSELRVIQSSRRTLRAPRTLIINQAVLQMICFLRNAAISSAV